MKRMRGNAKVEMWKIAMSLSSSPFLFYFPSFTVDSHLTYYTSTHILSTLQLVQSRSLHSTLSIHKPTSEAEATEEASFPISYRQLSYANPPGAQKARTHKADELRERALQFTVMDSFTRSTGFPYSSNRNTMADPDEDDSEFSGILEIYVHHARNIHNICIYDKQDVYAKFSLTYNPDEMLSTRIIHGGGKNPEFNESLAMKVSQLDGVLKCEIWMLSRARNYMEDQLLGFALVPISQLVGQGKVTQDYSLSSTDLFHSPAGTVKLTLSISTSSLPFNFSGVINSSISSEVVLLDRKVPEVLDPVEYSRIEFPDISVVRENQQMVSEYFDGLNSRTGSFLHLGASPHHPVPDYEMNTSSSEENQPVSSGSPSGSIQNSGFLSSTMTSISDDRVSSDSMDKKSCLTIPSSNPPNVAITREVNHGSGASPDTPTSKKGSEISERDSSFSSNEEEASNKEGNMNSVKFGGQVFSAPIGSTNTESEQAAMQQQIVDMYMKSMQQFTESLAKMKLPMDLDKPETENRGDLIQVQANKPDVEKKKKDGSRVFYGSRAFF